MPALSGVLFSTGYTLTIRTMNFLQKPKVANNTRNASRASSPTKAIKSQNSLSQNNLPNQNTFINKKKSSKTNNSQNHFFPSTIFEKDKRNNPRVGSMIKKPNTENLVSVKSNESKKLNLAIDGDSKKKSNLTNPSSTSYQKSLSYQHEKIIEKLFQTLPEP